MTEAFIKLLPIAIAGAFVPTWTSRVIILLATKRPVTNGLGFVLGNMVFRFALGLSVLFAARTPVIVEAADQADSAVGAMLILAAALMLSLAFWLWRKPPQAEEGLPVWMRALESVRPWMSLVYGLALVAMPGVQYVYFMSGMAVISSVEGTPEMLLLLAIFVCLLQAMLITPVLVFVWKRERADHTLNSMRDWIARNGQRATAALVAVFGVTALIIGLNNLLGD